tara:strand:- start:1098 stop:1343 length:246 start_codon:yes stop_codon:yes gene_type:complete
MKRAFIANIDVPTGSPSEMETISEVIHEALLDQGLEVISVQPWQTQEELALDGLTSGAIPGQQVQPNNQQPPSDPNQQQLF